MSNWEKFNNYVRNHLVTSVELVENALYLIIDACEMDDGYAEKIEDIIGRIKCSDSYTQEINSVTGIIALDDLKKLGVFEND